MIAPTPAMLSRALNRAIDRAADEAAEIAEPVFREEGWTYGPADCEYLPGYADLYAMVERLLRELIASPALTYVSSGRFVAYRERDTRTIEVALEIASMDDPHAPGEDAEPYPPALEAALAVVERGCADHEAWVRLRDAINDHLLGHAEQVGGR